MKAEKPAVGILKRNDFGDSKVYQVVCECHSPDHDHNVFVEADNTGVSVTYYVTVKSKWWELSRWRKMWILLTKGYVEYESTLIMSQQQALNYAETLKSAIKDVSEFKKPQNLKEKT